MGKHTPLPSDPVERAAEKKRRFAVYHKEYRKIERAAYRARRLVLARQLWKERQDLRRAAIAANLDLIQEL